MQALLKINTEGRLRFVEGDDREVLPGIRCYIGGKHTHESQFCSVKTAEGTAGFTTDNVYLYENGDKQVLITQTVGGDGVKASNLFAPEPPRALAASPMPHFPCHYPAAY